MEVFWTPVATVPRAPCETQKGRPLARTALLELRNPSRQKFEPKASYMARRMFMRSTLFSTANSALLLPWRYSR